MACRVRGVLLCASVVSVAVTGCTGGIGLSQVPASPSHVSASPSHVSASHPAPLTGVKLSALVHAPTGFTLDRSASSDSGARENIPVPGASSTSDISCASWWSGTAYFGPGAVGYTIRNYTGPDRITLNIEVAVYPAGTGARVYDMSVALQRRCRHFGYLDRDGLRYVVSATVGASAGIGDHSQEVNATETAPDGAVFTTRSTFIDVGDALVAATETGSPGAPLNRAALPLTTITAALRSAGY
jgi:hypothetical protein